LKCKDCYAFGHAASNQEETSKEVPKVNVTKDRSVQNPWSKDLEKANLSNTFEFLKRNKERENHIQTEKSQSVERR
jgi:ribosome-binding protein aMBF1 (putative translation factor)